MSNHSNLAKFAFNIYGTLSNDNSPPSSSSSTKSRRPVPSINKFVYNCEREIQCLTALELSPHGLGTDLSDHHVVIGGKNYLKLLMLNYNQTSVINEVNILDPIPNSRVSGNKILNFNTIKANHSLLATGLVNGSINLYQIQNNGKSRLSRKLNEHKRCINSLDFYDPVNGDSSNISSNLLISGSQDGTIKLWDLRQANVKPVINIAPKSNYDSVRSCQFSSHSAVRNKLSILSVHDSGTLNKYDLRSLSPSNQMVERKWNFHSGPALSLHIHPELEYVITCGRDQKVCVWNFGENNNSFTMNSPQYVLHTYGPVSKVRWCQYGTTNSNSMDEEDEEESSSPNALFKYDFACSYLNEDPTITVYNLKRKYVPKEIIQSYSNKPYQNFIWSPNSLHQRRIWSLSKGNQFASQDLDTESDFEHLSRPSETLNSVPIAWGNGIGDISIISQERSDFENTIPLADSYSEFENEIDFNNDPFEDRFNKVVVGSVPNSFPNSIGGSQNVSQSNSTSASLGTSPIEVPRPLLLRASTGLQVKKSPSPSPQIKNSLSFYDSPISGGLQRPNLGRNPSQTTIDSTLSYGSSPTGNSYVPDIRRAIQVNHASPYIIPLSLPLPLNDDIVFETLSNNYLVTIPDGFSLMDVCLLNASVAASVNRFRDCQIWRMLATGLEQHINDVENEAYDTEIDESHHKDSVHENDNQSISSDLGNFVGSYNSNSTSTTNYGESVPSESTGEKKSIKNLLSTSYNETKSLSTNNLMDTINQNRNNSFNGLSISPNLSRSNSIIAQMNKLAMKKNNEDNEQAVEDDDEEEEEEESAPVGNTSENPKTKDEEPTSLKRHSSVPVFIPSEPEENIKSTSPKNKAILDRMRSSRGGSFVRSNSGSGTGFLNSKDLDNENLNIMNSAMTNSFSSGVSGSVADHKSSVGSLPSNVVASFKSRRSSSIAPTYGFLNSRTVYGNGLDEVDEISNTSQSEVKESGLTKAIEETKKPIPKNNDGGIPWDIGNLIEKALDYASLQGDIILCSSLALLFHSFSKSLKLYFLGQQTVLEWLSLYIEILHKKQLFVNAMNILNIAPRELKAKLLLLYNSEGLRLYCDNCNELLTNENTKPQMKENFGYWYCEKCHKRQRNCVYCNEPCNGLNVVISLKCGHRGHFGCLKEWFIDEENLECPGACNEILF